MGYTRIGALLFFLAATLTGCSANAPGHGLIVDLKTDLIPQAEFFAIRTTITSELADTQPAIVVQSDVEASGDYVRGLRIGEFQQLNLNEITVEVSLLDNEGRVLVTRPTRVSLSRLQAITVVISRDCRGVKCPLADGDPDLAACMGGVCVDPRCSPETIEYCDSQALECALDAECLSDQACVTPTCVEQVCFFAANDTLCEALQLCIPESGCIGPTDTLEPTCNDGLQNGNETSIDCGGECLCVPDEWISGFGDTAMQQGQSIAVDSAGNSYIGGIFSFSIDFGGGPLSQPDDMDTFLASFDPAGNHRWSKQLAVPMNGLYRILTVDTDDNIYMSGHYDSDAFVVSYDNQGTTRWSHMLDSEAGSLEPGAMSSDEQGHIYMVGTFAGAADFGSGISLTSESGSRDIFVARFDTATGDCLWANAYGSDAIDEGLAIVTTHDGRHFVTGNYENAFSFGGSMLPDAVGRNVFIAGFASNGSHVWSVGVGSSQGNGGNGVALGPDGRLLVAGYFSTPIDFGTGAMSPQGANDVFVVSFDDQTGQAQWSTSIGGYAGDMAKAITVSPQGVVYVGGDFQFTTNIAGTDYASNGGWDMFVAAYDAATGNLLGANVYGGSIADFLGSLVWSAGALHVIGSFQNQVDFNGTLLETQSNLNVFVMKMVFP